MLLAVGTLLLAGGGVLAATGPTAPRRAHAIATPAMILPATGRASSAPAAPSLPRASGAQVARSGSSGPTSRGFAKRRAARSPAGSSSSVTYVVKPGDTLSGIADWFKLHGYGSLYAANAKVIGTNPNLIFSGERITISHGVMTLRRAARHDGSSV